MNATAERAGPGPLQKIERIVDFVPERVRAPFFLRCGALLTDYIIFISVPVIGLLLGRYMGNDGPKLLAGSLNDAGWLIAGLLGFVNIIVLPMFTAQTIGKMLAGLRIVRTDGGTPTKRSIIFRQTFGYLLTAATLGIGFLVSVFGRKGRALHDLISGTMVIYADRQIR
ncbi:MAG: RDD family protein [Pyrinomonadaceae bacterium]